MIRYHAKCICTIPDGSSIEINSSGVYPEEHRAEAHREFTWDIFGEIVKNGGPWGWHIGALAIVSCPEDAWHDWYGRLNETGIGGGGE